MREKLLQHGDMDAYAKVEVYDFSVTFHSTNLKVDIYLLSDKILRSVHSTLLTQLRQPSFPTKFVITWPFLVTIPRLCCYNLFPDINLFPEWTYKWDHGLFLPEMPPTRGGPSQAVS